MKIIDNFAAETSAFFKILIVYIIFMLIFNSFLNVIKEVVLFSDSFSCIFIQEED
jgi:hypothetical protein